MPMWMAGRHKWMLDFPPTLFTFKVVGIITKDLKNCKEKTYQTINEQQRPFAVAKMTYRIHSFLSMASYFQPPIWLKQSESRPVITSYSFPVLQISFAVFAQVKRDTRWRTLSNNMLVGQLLQNPCEKTSVPRSVH